MVAVDGIRGERGGSGCLDHHLPVLVVIVVPGFIRDGVDDAADETVWSLRASDIYQGGETEP